jgi:tRNA-uridine 2-sulfurtransferase
MLVMVAMSGGVDSSVAAALVRDAGHEAVGVTLKLWGGESDTGCCSVSDVDDARRVCHQLGIDHVVFNFTEEFDTHVVDPYVADHQLARTPNPCIECNRHLKFDRLIRRARQLGADAVATGHHARIVDHDGQRWVARGADAAKDQSYVVHMLSGEALAMTEFPVGHLTKDEVRVIAARLGLRTATKPDSQDVCFISRSAGRESFLRRRIPLTPATVVDTSGAVRGRVDAIELVTLGQRRGLDLGGGSDRLFVVGVDPVAHTVVVGSEHELTEPLTPIESVQWVHRSVSGVVDVQVSAHGTVAPGQVTNEPLGIRWAVPHRRVAPGQSVVFYDGDRVLGGAIVGATSLATTA